MERYFYPLLKNFKELYLETSTMRLPMGIKNICDTFGDHRFVFGSGWPVMTPASALTELRYSAISKEARNNIFSGNINRILGEVKL
jgi:predicted TIM-barrel fold metal-dependent hydrolase